MIAYEQGVQAIVQHTAAKDIKSLILYNLKY